MTVWGFLRSVGVVAGAVSLLQVPTAANEVVLARLDQYLDALRQQAGIRGLSAAIVQNGTVAWERGYGLADVENSVPTRPDTPFAIGGLTQTLSAALALQCVESGTLGLNQPAGTSADGAAGAGASIRHVLSHTSAGTPGTVFNFDLARFATLTSPIERCTRTDIRQALHRDLFLRLGMTDTVPARFLRDLDQALDSGNADFESVDAATIGRWNSVLRRLATPYRVDKNGRATPGGPLADSELGVNAAVGVISTVRDLARFLADLGDGVVLRPESLVETWTNTLLNDGRPTPAGLGWFVQAYNGERVVWQFGMKPEGYSSLMLHIPARRVSVILLANTDGLAADIPLHEGDVRVSPFARLFLQLFL